MDSSPAILRYHEIPLPLELKEMIIDEIAALGDFNATLEAFRASKVWWPEAKTRSRMYLFANITLNVEKLPKFLAIFRHTPFLKLAVRGLYIVTEKELTALRPLPPHDGLSARLLEAVSGMTKLEDVRFHHFNFVPLDSQSLFQILRPCTRLTCITINGGAASLRTIAALLCALQSLLTLHIFNLRLSDHHPHDLHCSRVLDFQDPATRTEFGVSLTGLAKPLELDEVTIDTADGRKPELGGYLVDLLSTSGIVESITHVEVDVWHIDASVRQRLQNLLDLTDFLVIRNLESFDEGGIHLQPLQFTHQTGYHFDIFTDSDVGETHSRLKDRNLFYWHLRSLATLDHTLDTLSIYIFRDAMATETEPRPLPFLADDKAAWEALDSFLSLPVTEQLIFYLEVDLWVHSSANLGALWKWWEDLLPRTLDRFEFVEDRRNKIKDFVLMEGHFK